MSYFLVSFVTRWLQSKIAQMKSEIPAPPTMTNEYMVNHLNEYHIIKCPGERDHCPTAEQHVTGLVGI